MAPQRKTFPRLFLPRSDPFRLNGERVFLRPAERGDYEAWATLRAQSRAFLAPWEPSWPPDALARTSFRARIARYAEDWRTDQGYNFFIFRADETLVGGAAAGARFRVQPAAAASGRGRLPADQHPEPRAPHPHRLPAGRLRAAVSLHRRQMAGPPALRNAPRRLAVASGFAWSFLVIAELDPAIS